MSDINNSTTNKNNYLENISGGITGNQKYSKKQYERAGIKWKHHYFRPDEFYFNNEKISRASADIIVFGANLKYKSSSHDQDNN